MEVLNLWMKAHGANIQMQRPCLVYSKGANVGTSEPSISMTIQMEALNHGQWMKVHGVTIQMECSCWVRLKNAKFGNLEPSRSVTIQMEALKHGHGQWMKVHGVTIQMERSCWVHLKGANSVGNSKNVDVKLIEVLYEWIKRSQKTFKGIQIELVALNEQYMKIRSVLTFQIKVPKLIKFNEGIRL